MRKETSACLANSETRMLYTRIFLDLWKTKYLFYFSFIIIRLECFFFFHVSNLIIAHPWSFIPRGSRYPCLLDSQKVFLEIWSKTNIRNENVQGSHSSFIPLLSHIFCIFQFCPLFVHYFWENPILSHIFHILSMKKFNWCIFMIIAWLSIKCSPAAHD